MSVHIPIKWGDYDYLVVKVLCFRHQDTPEESFKVFWMDMISRTVTLPIHAGTTGRLDFLLMFISPFIPSYNHVMTPRALAYVAAVDEESRDSSQYKLRWKYACSQEGLLKLDYDAFVDNQWSSPVSLTMVTTDLLGKSRGETPYLKVKASLSYSEGDEEGEVALMPEIGPIGFFITAGKNPKKTNNEEVIMTVKFDVTGAKQTFNVPPDKIIYFDHEGQVNMGGNPSAGNTIPDLKLWADRLKSDKEVFEALGKRYFPIELTGYASETATDAFDLHVTEQRVDYVEKVLVGFLGSRPYGEEIWFNKEWLGKTKAKVHFNGLPKQPDRAYLYDRRVEITVDPTRFIEGMRLFREGKPAPPGRHDN